MYQLSLPSNPPRATGTPSRVPPLRRFLGLLVSAAVMIATGCAAQPPFPIPGVGPLSPQDPQAPATSGAPNPSATQTPILIPEPAKLTAKLNKVSRKGIKTSGLMVLSPDGEVLSGRGGNKALAPASTMKVLTALTALEALGGDHRFTTKVAQNTRGELILIGGGDPYLVDKPSKSKAKQASLAELAKATAAALKADGVFKVRVGYDDSLFTGPDFSPDWQATFKPYTSRIRALVVNQGMVHAWKAETNPAHAAAVAFAAQLKAAGMKKATVTGRVKAPADASEIAQVQSAPLRVMVGRTLVYSDNLAAETFARHAALATGRPASFEGASQAITAWLDAHQINDPKIRILDGSGLAKDSRLTPKTLARAIQIGYADDRLRPAVDQLPVAGKNGTMKNRFNDKSEKIGRGNVQAKTGTLRGIATLAGQLTTKDGARLTFALMANDTVGQTTGYNWLDRSAAAMVKCGCS